MQYKVSVAAAFVLFSLVASLGRTETPPSFQEAIKGFAKSRNGIRSFRVVATAGIKESLEPRRLTNGATVVPTQETTSYVLEVVVDKEAKSKLICSYVERRGTNGDDTDRATAVLRVDTPAFTIRANQRRGAVTPASEPPQSREYSLPSMPAFDPLAIGFGFAGDISRGESWEKIFSNYRKWNPRPSEKLDNGSIRFGHLDDIRPDFIEMDPRKGFLPTRLQHPNSGDDVYSVDLKSKPVNGHWLPSFATIWQRDRVEVIEFSWEKVNEDVSGFFTTDDVKDRFGIELVDRR